MKLELDHGNCEQVTFVMIPLKKTQARSMPVTWNTPTPKMVRSSKNWNNKVRSTLNLAAFGFGGGGETVLCTLTVDATKGKSMYFFSIF